MREARSADSGIEYPLRWRYRIVADADAAGLPERLAGLFAAHGIAGAVVEPSRDSSSGKYRSFSAEVTLADAGQAAAVDRALAALPGVKFVL